MSNSLTLLALILVFGAVSQASLLSYDLDKLILEEINYDCDNTDFDSILEDVDNWSEVAGLHETGQLEKELLQLNKIQLHANQAIQLSAKALMQNEEFDVTIQQLESELSTLQEQYKQDGGERRFLINQCDQVKEQIQKVCTTKQPETKKNSLAMLVGLLEYLVQELRKIESQCTNKQITKERVQVTKQKVVSAQSTCKAKKAKYVRPAEPEPVQPIKKQVIVTDPKPVISTPKELECEKPVEQLTPTPPPRLPTPPPPSPPKEPEICAPKPPKCIQGSEKILVSSYKQEYATLQSDLKNSEISDSTEYGYGFWFRFLTLYPVQMKSGLIAKNYFISSLAGSLNKHEPTQLDSLLDVEQNQNSFIFGALTQQNKLDTQEIVFGDIEGTWTYLYFSYSLKQQSASLFYKQTDKTEITELIFDIIQPVPLAIRFTLGGKQGDKPGFNGQFSRPVLKIGQGSYIKDKAEFLNFNLACNPEPAGQCIKLQQIDFVKERKEFTIQDKAHPKPHLIDANFSDEYSVDGWFRWNPTSEQAIWNMMFRLTTVLKKKSKMLFGQRTLSAWIGKPNGGQLHFATYSYADLKGAGNPNTHQFISHKDQHTHWHYTYFGYSRSERKAIVVVLFKDSKQELVFENVNHFMAQQFYFYFAYENQFPSYNGQISHLAVSLCRGAYTTNPEPKNKPLPTPVPVCVPKIIEKKCIEGPAQLINSAYDKEAVVSVHLVKKDLKDTSEYGFGFWFRYLSLHPTPYDGPRPQWQQLARLSNVQESEHIKDGLLTVSQGTVGYFYSSHDDESEKIQELASRFEDIEGVWTYTYFSYTAGKIAAYLQFDGQQPIILKGKASHPKITELFFTISGTDKESRFAGFNGQFSRPTLRIGAGSYFEDQEDFDKFALSCNSKPVIGCAASGNFQIVNEQTSEFKGKPIRADKFQFPEQYAVAGWFKWTGSEEPKAQLLFRLAANNKNRKLKLSSDNTLAVTLNPKSQSLIFTSYSYADLTGKNTKPVIQSLQGKEFIEKWHHIYFAYSRKLRTAQVIVEHSEGKGTLTFKQVNHFLSPYYFLFFGKDKRSNPYSGFIYNLNLFLCENAYNMEYIPTPKPVEVVVQPKREPVCLLGEEYENITLENIELVIEELQKKKCALLNQEKPEETMCFCFISEHKELMSEQEKDGPKLDKSESVKVEVKEDKVESVQAEATEEKKEEPEKEDDEEAQPESEACKKDGKKAGKDGKNDDKNADKDGKADQEPEPEEPAEAKVERIQ